MKKNMHPIKRAQRQERRRASSHSAKLPCLFCVELDHTAGKNHDSELISPDICQKHHRELTERRLDADIKMEYEPNPIKRVVLALKATSVFLSMLADALWRWAEFLNAQAKQQGRGMRPAFSEGTHKRTKITPQRSS